MTAREKEAPEPKTPDAKRYRLTKKSEDPVWPYPMQAAMGADSPGVLADAVADAAPKQKDEFESRLLEIGGLNSLPDVLAGVPEDADDESSDSSNSDSDSDSSNSEPETPQKDPIEPETRQNDPIDVMLEHVVCVQTNGERGCGKCVRSCRLANGLPVGPWPAKVRASACGPDFGPILVGKF